MLIEKVNEENIECIDNICLPILFRILTKTKDNMAQFLMKSGGTPKEQARRRTEVCWILSTEYFAIAAFGDKFRSSN